MKRIAILSVVALLVVSAVYAPDATAQAPGEVDILTTTIGPKDWFIGSNPLIVTGTIECPTPRFPRDPISYQVDLKVTQGDTVGNQGERGKCLSGGPLPFTMTIYGLGPKYEFRSFKRNVATEVSWRGYVCCPENTSDGRFVTYPS